MKNKRVYPQWFIDELVNEEDKEKAMDGSLKLTNRTLFKCSMGHVYEQVIRYHIRFSTGEKKQGCPICGKVKNNESRLKTISSKRVYPEWFIDELVNEEDKEKARNGSLMNTSKVEFRCDKGHIYKQRVYDHIIISSGERKNMCSICSKLKLHEKRMKTISSKRVYPEWFIDELVNEEDKEKAKNGSLMNNAIVEFKCNKGHIYKQRVRYHINISSSEKRNRCPKCSNNRSRPELDIEKYVRLLGYSTEHRRFRDSNDKLFEIDIFIPEKNVGIEYNGSKFHSSIGIFEGKDTKYHFMKYMECKKKDILLITIFDIEWEQKEHKIKQYIKDILNNKENKLSYNKDGYMNNNYPSWKYYKSTNKSNCIEDYYIYQNKYEVYTCGYTKLE